MMSIWIKGRDNWRFYGFKEYLRYIFIFLFDKVSHFNKKVIFVGIKVID